MPFCKRAKRGELAFSNSWSNFCKRLFISNSLIESTLFYIAKRSNVCNASETTGGKTGNPGLGKGLGLSKFFGFYPGA
jgi:hypothetical protein